MNELPRAPHEAGTPTVAVIIAAFNAEAFIGRALRSASEQSVLALEILVVDDSSSDGTAKAVTDWARKDRRVKLIQSEINRGPSAARNLGISQTRAEWVAVLDADDAYLPGRLSKLINLAQQASADIVADNFYYYDPQTDCLGRTALDPSEDRSELIDLATYVDRCRPFRHESDYGLLKPIFRRSFLLQHDLSYPERIRHGEDFALTFEALRSGARFLVFRTPMYLYSKRSSGHSRTLVDYSQAINHAKNAKDAVEEPAVIRRLTIRIDSLRHLQARTNLNRHVANRDYIAVARLVIGSRYGAAQASVFAIRRLRLVLRKAFDVISASQ